MFINEQLIRELQKRVDLSYEEAERYLRRSDGDIDVAEDLFKQRENSLGKRFIRELEKIIDVTIVYRIELYKEDEVFINLPVLVFIVMVVIVGVNAFLFLGVVFVIVSLLLDCRLHFHKVEREEVFTFQKTVYKDDIKRKGTSKYRTNEKSTSTQEERSERKAEKNREKASYSEFSDVDFVEVDPNFANSKLVEPKVVDTTKVIQVEVDEDDGYYEVTIDK